MNYEQEAQKQIDEQKSKDLVAAAKTQLNIISSKEKNIEKTKVASKERIKDIKARAKSAIKAQKDYAKSNVEVLEKAILKAEENLELIQEKKEVPESNYYTPLVDLYTQRESIYDWKYDYEIYPAYLKSLEDFANVR